jgi:hypothetical protein
VQFMLCYEGKNIDDLKVQPTDWSTDLLTYKIIDAMDADTLLKRPKYGHFLFLSRTD